MKIKRPSCVEEKTTKAQLLRVGKTLFASKGLEGATVRELAQLAGVNICMISYHFNGKEGLYRACIEEFGKGRMAVVQSLLSPIKTKSEFQIRLKLILEALTTSLVEEPDLHRILMREYESGLTVAKDVFENTFLLIMRKLISFFKDAQKAGIVRKNLDPFYLGIFLHGTMGHMLRIDFIAQTYFNRSLHNVKQREKLIDNVLEILEGCLERDCA